MSSPLRRAAVLSLVLAAITAGAANAADDPNAAPLANPRADETAAQIDDWLREAAAEPPAEAGDAPARPVDRQMHGEFGAAIGTGGYRSAYGVVTMPIGKTGTATVAFSEGRARFRGRGVSDRSLALSLELGGEAGRSTAPDRARACGPFLAPGPFNRGRWGPASDAAALTCLAPNE